MNQFLVSQHLPEHLEDSNFIKMNRADNVQIKNNSNNKYSLAKYDHLLSWYRCYQNEKLTCMANSVFGMSSFADFPSLDEKLQDFDSENKESTISSTRFHKWNTFSLVHIYGTSQSQGVVSIWRHLSSHNKSHYKNKIVVKLVIL